MPCIGNGYCPNCKRDISATCLCLGICPDCNGKLVIEFPMDLCLMTKSILEPFPLETPDKLMNPPQPWPEPPPQPDIRKRKYLPTLAELIDRMSICILKSIFIPENKPAYDKEVKDIEHDIDLLLEDAGNVGPLNARAIKAILVIMLSNRYIWENESLCRKGDNQDFSLLKKTHSINGVRNTAKNEIAVVMGERKDLKIDCLAAELLSGKENWDIFK